MAKRQTGIVRGGENINRFIKQNKIQWGVKKVDIGFFDEAKYPNGTQVAAVAAWNEFGTKNAPERPFFRNAIAEAAEPLKRALKEQVDPENMQVDRRVGKILGQIVEDAIKDSITTLKAPPNAPSTIALKGSSNPLIDTATMRNSVATKVDPKDPD